MKTIKFSNITWLIKDGNGKGPGPNNWYENNVYVDREGSLHLRIAEINGKWCCAEIISVDNVNHGEYLFDIETNVEQLGKNIVLGLFIYQDDYHELDIEFLNGESSYCVQPDQIHRFTMNLNTDYSKHKLTYLKNSISFSSFHRPHNIKPIIYEWNALIKNIPQPDKSHLHINLWLKNGRPPKIGSEVIIRSIKIKYAEHAEALH